MTQFTVYILQEHITQCIHSSVHFGQKKKTTNLSQGNAEMKIMFIPYMACLSRSYESSILPLLSHDFTMSAITPTRVPFIWPFHIMEAASKEVSNGIKRSRHSSKSSRERRNKIFQLFQKCHSSAHCGM